MTINNSNAADTYTFTITEAPDSNPVDWFKDVEVPVGWVNVSGSHDSELHLCKITHQEVLECAPLVVSCSLIIKQDCSWMLHVHGRRVDPDLIPPLTHVSYCIRLNHGQCMMWVRTSRTC